AAIREQNVLISSGRAIDTGKSPNDFHGDAGNGRNGIDPVSHQTALQPGLTAQQIFSMGNGQSGPGGVGGRGLVPLSGRSPNAPKVP
ncbi:MAG: hypothetical protein H7Y43_07340, partial [Akkermansiaceae bacterium]|nr:hypothetical protein [Verrucomicrobiales bacterium]